MAPNKWIDKHRAVEQIVWHPGKPEVVEDAVMQAGGWRRHKGSRVFNLYLPPVPMRRQCRRRRAVDRPCAPRLSRLRPTTSSSGSRTASSIPA